MFRKILLRKRSSYLVENPDFAVDSRLRDAVAIVVEENPVVLTSGK